MTHDEWLKRYRRAWIDRDGDAAATLFTEDAIYREHPFQEPFIGREAIRRYLFDQSRTLRIKQLLGLDGSTGSIRSRRSRRRHSDPRTIFMSFRGLQAQE